MKDGQWSYLQWRVEIESGGHDLVTIFCVIVLLSHALQCIF